MHTHFYELTTVNQKKWDVVSVPFISPTSGQITQFNLPKCQQPNRAFQDGTPGTPKLQFCDHAADPMLRYTCHWVVHPESLLII